MGVFDFLKKDKTPRLFRFATQTAGVANVKRTTLIGAYKVIYQEVKTRKAKGETPTPDMLIADYRDTLDPEWSAMCAKVGITDSDIYRMMEEAIKADEEVGLPIHSPKIGRNSPCPCGSGKKYKRCCGA